MDKGKLGKLDHIYGEKSIVPRNAILRLFTDGVAQNWSDFGFAQMAGMPETAAKCQKKFYASLDKFRKRLENQLDENTIELLDNICLYREKNWSNQEVMSRVSKSMKELREHLILNRHE